MRLSILYEKIEKVCSQGDKGLPTYIPVKKIKQCWGHPVNVVNQKYKIIN